MICLVQNQTNLVLLITFVIRLGFKSVKTSFLKFFQDQLSRLTAQQGMLYEEHYKLKTDLKTKSAAQQIINSDSDLQV